jgi:hypothetical protein
MLKASKPSRFGRQGGETYVGSTGKNSPGVKACLVPSMCKEMFVLNE